MTRTRIAFAIGVAGLVIGCVDVTESLNQSFCTNALGNRTCAEHYPDGSRPYCVVSECLDRDFGCVAEVPTDGCASPCGAEDPGCELADDSTSSEPGTESSTGESGSESGSGSESSTTGPLPCTRDDECTDAAAPFCELGSGECVACNGMTDPDAACAGADPGLPLCVDGACVQCTAAAPEACSGKTPVCDEGTNTCVPCTAHAQCAGGAACNLYIGACLPADRVFEVGGATPDFPNLSMAFDSLDPDTETTLIVHPGMPSYDEALTVDGGRVVAFLAADIGPGITPPGWIQSSAGVGPQLTVTAGAAVLLDGLQLSSNADDVGLRVDGGRAWLDRSRIVTNLGGGIVAEVGAELTLRNCFVGGDVNDITALALNGATATILYTTAGAGFGDAVALACEGGATAEVRNSLFVARTDTDEVQCGGATIDHTAAEMDLGGTNTAVGAMATTWFEGYGGGNFHLMISAPITIATTARWEDGDPLLDIDGDARPGVDGLSDVAGADIP